MVPIGSSAHAHNALRVDVEVGGIHTARYVIRLSSSQHGAGPSSKTNYGQGVISGEVLTQTSFRAPHVRYTLTCGVLLSTGKRWAMLTVRQGGLLRATRLTVAAAAVLTLTLGATQREMLFRDLVFKNPAWVGTVRAREPR